MERPLALWQVAFYLNACQNTKLLSVGNAATNPSNIKNIHETTRGSFPADTRCKRQQRPLIWEIRILWIRKKRLWLRFRVVTC